MRKTGNGMMTQSEESMTLMPASPATSFINNGLWSSPITAIDFSRSLRMTLNVSLTTAANPLLLFRMTPNGNHMLRLLTHS